MPLITDSFLEYVRTHPDQPAIHLGGVNRTYGELGVAVQQVASAVQAIPISTSRHLQGQHQSPPPPWIAILMPNGVELLEVFLGTALAGGVAMVLNPDWPLSQIQAILNRWTPDLLIAESSILEALGESWHMEKAIALHPPHKSSFLDYEHWKTQSLNADTILPPPDTTPFYIGFTSGTTGMPKGVIRNHRSWVLSFQASQVEFGRLAGEHILVPGSLVHSLSLYSAVEALAHGATLHLLLGFTPKAALHSLTRHPMARLVAVPTILSAIARAASRTNLQIPALRTLISGGSKLSPTLRAHLHFLFPNAHIMEYYGASELSFITLASSAEPIPAQSVGRAFHGVELSVRQNDGTEAPTGEIGWIGVRSEMVCSGYLEATDRTGFRIVQGWATVGDRGWLDDRGYLYLAGRESDMLICNGINVYPSEIEAVLVNHPDIEEAIALGLPDDCRGDSICAIILQREEQPQAQELTRRYLLDYMKAHLEPAKCPRRFFLIRDVPLTTSGKVNRLTLKQAILNGSLDSHEL